MIRPRKMKQVELTVLDRDVDLVIEYLGRRGVMHFSGEGAPGHSPKARDEIPEGGNYPEEPGLPGTGAPPAAVQHSLDEAARKHILENLEKLKQGASYLGVDLPDEPEESSRLPGTVEEELTDKITYSIALLSSRENEKVLEKKKV